MDIKEYIEKMKEIQTNLLTFLENENNNEENYQNLNNIIDNQKIKADRYDLKTYLYLINRISNNHYRIHDFISKIEQILNDLKSDIVKQFTNIEIFEIFKKNKRILLYLIQEKIVTVDKNIYTEMMQSEFITAKYPEYFYPEIESFIKEDEQYSIDFSVTNINTFNEKRKLGENDGYLYKLIQNDLIGEFITFIDRNNYSLNSIVEESIFETNSFLLKRETTLIEYASFFGSVQIFNYLYKNKAKITKSLLIYSIHGENPEIFHILEKILNKKNKEEEEEEEEDYSSEYEDSENQIDSSFENCFFESIKCHNFMANYIEENLLKDHSYKIHIISNSFHYYNFAFFPEKLDNNNAFFYACKYDYYKIVKFLLKSQKIDINAKIIQTL